MPIRRVLIVAKKSAYQLYFNEYQKRPLRRLVRKGDQALDRIRSSHDTHYRTLSHVKAALKERGVNPKVCFRGESFDADRYDLVISVGGDGSFLEASHRLRGQLILGVNSDKKHSVGNFCRAGMDDFEKKIDDLLRGKFRVIKLNRLTVNFNGKVLGLSVLNDILVCHICPASMSRYVLKVGRLTESQRSSGLWVATAAGSSGAIRSAGGKILPRTSDRIQYMPREPFEGHGQRYRLKGGVLLGGSGLSVISQMQEGRVYLDGAHHPFRFQYGDRISLTEGISLNTVSFS